MRLVITMKDLDTGFAKEGTVEQDMTDKVRFERNAIVREAAMQVYDRLQKAVDA